MIAITGATGFIGSALCAELSARGLAHRPVARGEQNFADISCVIHCAGIAHRAASLKEYEEVNLQATVQLAHAATQAGVKRFIFISTAKEGATDPYVNSKRRAENALWQLAHETGLEVVVVRPPLVYGPGVKANFARLIGLAQSGLPLPLAGIENKRSFIALQNLVDFFIVCAQHPSAAGHTFTVSDGHDISTPDLIRVIHAATPDLKPALRLWALPPSLLKFFATLLGFKNEIATLTESATVDSTLAQDLLSWKPKVTLQEGLKQTLIAQASRYTLSYRFIKRVLDIALAFAALAVFFIPMLIIALAIRFTSPGPAIYWSNRVGRNNVLFKMPKFRSMRIDTPALATHLLTEPKNWLTPIGGFLRKTSLDELPQLWSVLKGDMTLVGPRPALFNQHDLVALRTQANIHKLRPGITGWAQVNGRDELEIPQKVAFENDYARRASLGLDLKILFLTVARVFRSHGVRH